MNQFIRIVTSVAQKSVLKMIAERGGSVRMNISEKAITPQGRQGILAMERLGLIKITQLVGTEEHDLRLTDLGVKLVTQVIQGINKR